MSKHTLMRIPVITLIVLAVAYPSLAGPTPKSRLDCDGCTKTTRSVRRVSEAKGITNNRKVPVNDLHVWYCNDGRAGVNWEPGYTGETTTPGWDVDGITQTQDGDTDCIEIDLSGNDIAPGESVVVGFDGKLTKFNYVRKFWQWSINGVPVDVANDPGPGVGGGKSEVEGETGRRTVPGKRYRQLFIDNPSVNDVVIRNLKWQATSDVVTCADLVAPAFWAGVRNQPDMPIATEDYSPPIPVYDHLDTDTLAFTFDRYEEGQYVDTLYVAGTPDGAAWDFKTILKLTNGTGVTQTDLAYETVVDDAALSLPAATSGDFASASAVLTDPHTMDVAFAGGSVVDGATVTVCSSASMDGGGSPYLTGVEWGDGSAAADDFAFVFMGDWVDEVFDVNFTYRNDYTMPVMLTDIEYVINDIFLDSSQIMAWTEGYAALGADTLINSGEMAAFPIFGVRDAQSISVKYQVEGLLNIDDQDTWTVLEEVFFSHADVPEPATMSLLGMGLLALLRQRRKQPARRSLGEGG